MLDQAFISLYATKSSFFKLLFPHVKQCEFPCYITHFNISLYTFEYLSSFDDNLMIIDNAVLSNPVL